MKPWFGMHEKNISITLTIRKPLMHAKHCHNNIIEYPLVNFNRISSFKSIAIHIPQSTMTKLLQLIIL